MLLFLVFLALCLGYAIRRGSVCAVAAAESLVLQHRTARLRSFAVAAAGSGLVIVPAHWVWPDAFVLSPGYPASISVLAAGAVFGLGARFNGACALGTLSNLTGGNLTYGVSVLGMVAGAVLVSVTGLVAGGVSDLRPSPLEAPTAAGVLVFLLFFATVAVAIARRMPRWLRALREPGAMRLGPYRAMLLLGVCGGLLYALAGPWTYLSVLSHRAAGLVGAVPSDDGLAAILVAGTVAAGGTIAAWRSGQFHLRWEGLRTALRCMGGGFVMGAGAATIPGGNGTMLIFGLPSVAPHALAGYAAMMVVLCLSFLATGREVRGLKAGQKRPPASPDGRP